MKNSRILSPRVGPTKNLVLLVAVVMVSLLSATVFPLSPSPLSAVAKAEPGGIFRSAAGDSAARNRIAFRNLQTAAPTVPHVLPASYYTLKGNLRSTLTLNNKGPQPLDVQPTLFSLNGQRLDVPPVTVDGTSFRVIDLRQWVAPGAGFDEGSLQIAHYGMDMQLGAQVKIIDADQSLIFDEQLMAMMAMSSQLEAVWWLRSHKSKLRVALSNVTDIALTVTMRIEGITPRQGAPFTVNLTAHETRLVNPEDLAANGNGNLREIGGISIVHNGSPGALLARAFVGEASTGFSSSIEFHDPHMAVSSKLDGGGLRLGVTGGKELTPVVVARNLGNTESIIRGSMPYTTSAGAQSVMSIPEVRLAPGEVDTIDIARAIRRSGINTNRLVSAGLQFRYSTSPGSVVISAQSVSSDGDQVFRLPLIDADAQPSSTGGYPWSIQGSSSTFVYITNVTDRPQQYVLQLNFQGGVYAPGLKTVQPHQTAVIDLRTLRDSQVRDEHGHTIPGDKSSGQVTWSVEGGENLVLIGRAEQADIVNGTSSSYACVNCCPASCASTWVDPPSVTGFSGDTQQFTGFQQNEDCFGNLLSPFIHGAAWSSTNSSVATVNSTGFATAQNPGSTNIQGTWTAFLWDLNPNNTCTKTTFQPLADALCDVLAVSFKTARVSGTTANFDNVLRRAILNLPQGAFSDGICHDFTNFTCIVTFNVPDDAVALSADRSVVRPINRSSDSDTHDWFINGFTIQYFNSTPKSGEFVISMHRRTTGASEAPSISITVAGDYGTGTFSGTATLTINCP